MSATRFGCILCLSFRLMFVATSRKVEHFSTDTCRPRLHEWRSIKRKIVNARRHARVPTHASNFTHLTKDMYDFFAVCVRGPLNTTLQKNDSRLRGTNTHRSAQKRRQVQKGGTIHPPASYLESCGCTSGEMISVRVLRLDTHGHIATTSAKSGKTPPAALLTSSLAAAPAVRWSA